MPHRFGWRRLGPVALAFALATVLPFTVQAAPAGPNTASWFAHSAIYRLAPARLSAARLLHGLSIRGLRPALRTGAPLQQTVTDPTKLAFTPPSNAMHAVVGTVDTAFADDATKNPVAALGGMTYAESGMQSGYAETFSVPIGTGSDTVDIEYLATIYGSADQAAARVASNEQHLASKGLSSLSCGSSCYVFSFQGADNTGRTTDFSYIVWSNVNVVAELVFGVYDDVATANSGAFQAITNTVIGLATAAVPVQPAAGTPLTIVGFDLAHTVNKQAKLTHKLKSGEAGIFVADIQFPNPGDTIQAQVTFTLGKKTVGPLILGSPQNVSTTEVVLGASHKFKVKKTTSAVAHLQVQDGSAQVTKDLSFKITH